MHPPTGYHCSLYADVYAADYDDTNDDDYDYDSSNDDDIFMIMAYQESGNFHHINNIYVSNMLICVLYQNTECSFREYFRKYVINSI